MRRKRIGKKKLIELHAKAVRTARRKGVRPDHAQEFAAWLVERWMMGLSQHQLIIHSLYDWFDTRKYWKHEFLVQAQSEEELKNYFENREGEAEEKWVPTDAQLEKVEWFQTREGQIYLLVTIHQYLMKEVAEMFGITESRVCQIISYGRAVLQWMIDNQTTRTPTARELGKNKFGK